MAHLARDGEKAGITEPPYQRAAEHHGMQVQAERGGMGWYLVSWECVSTRRLRDIVSG